MSVFTTALALAVLSSALLSAPATALPRVRVGMASSDTPPFAEWIDGAPQGYEADVMRALMAEAGLEPQVVKLDTLDARISALENGTADVVMDAFTVTPDRSLQVKFVFPAYFSSGAALFAPGGQVPGVEAWADLAGQTVTTLQGNYVLDVQQDTPELRNLTIVAVPSAQAAEQLILAGKAVAFIEDSAALFWAGANLTEVASVPVILAEPMAAAVAIGNTELADKLSTAMLTLVKRGELTKLDEEVFVAAGGAPNPDLAALQANPTPGGSNLWPAQAA